MGPEDFDKLLSVLPGEKDVGEMDVEDYDNAMSKIKNEQIKLDVSPETMNPRREEEEWLAAHGDEEEYTFPERLPPGHEDYGFNAVVINDIGEELLAVEANMLGLRKAEILHKRLGRAIDALKEELRGRSSADEAVGTNDSVDGPYSEEADTQPMEESNDIMIEWD